MNKTPEQELDEVFHAIPEWVRRTYPEASNAERISKGFDEMRRVFTESLMREIKDHEKTKGFLLHVLQTRGLDFGNEYWNYLKSKDLEKDKKIEDSR